MCPGGTQVAKMEEPAIVASSLCQSNTGTGTGTGTSAHHHRHHHHSIHAFCPMNDEEQENCRHCGSHAIHTDWAQGDKVCTDCGVVSSERLMETRPEWREYNEAEDLAKGLPSQARCGMVPVDESRYLGGLQPTTMTKHPFGGNSTNANLALMRKKLLTTNRKIDHMMGQHHARALKNARVSRLVRKRQLLEGSNETDQSDLDSVVTTTDDDDVRPELEQILIQEEEDIDRMQSALNADKWSLRRAILLHGHHESMDHNLNSAETERDDLQRRLDSKLRKASADLYKAYQMLLGSSQRLQLPDRVTHEATNMLCKYAARRDGFVVKGVSSRLTTKKANISPAQQKKAAESLREHNKTKQMGSLCAALLLLTARKLGWPRPLTEVCGCVQPLLPSTNTSRPLSFSNTGDATFIKPKHCSRAMEEIKSSFPDYARSIAHTSAAPGDHHHHHHNQPTSSLDHNDPVATIHFVDHTVRRLHLPPVAEASIRALVWHVRQEQFATGQGSGTKLSTICASLAYFVCQAGSVMQRLAQQAQTRDHRNTSNQQAKSSKRVFSYSTKSKSKSISDAERMAPPPPKKPRTMVIQDEKKVRDSNDDDDNNNNDDADADANADEPFDVFSHDVGSDILEKKREYEMRRLWDTWAEQTTWSRTLADVEQSSGVSGTVILAQYKSSIFPRRHALLEWLKNAVDSHSNSNTTTANGGSNKDHVSNSSSSIQEDDDQQAANILTATPLASTLLSHVAAAAPLLTLPKAKQEKF